MSIEHFYKKRLTNGGISVEYDSEREIISVSIEHKLVMGAVIGTDHFEIYPSYVEPLHELLTGVSPDIQEAFGGARGSGKARTAAQALGLVDDTNSRAKTVPTES